MGREETRISRREIEECEDALSDKSPGRAQEQASSETTQQGLGSKINRPHEDLEDNRWTKNKTNLAGLGDGQEMPPKDRTWPEEHGIVKSQEVSNKNGSKATEHVKNNIEEGRNDTNQWEHVWPLIHPDKVSSVFTVSIFAWLFCRRVHIIFLALFES